MIFTKQLESINPVRDPAGDLATVARAGSKLIQEKREQRERAKVIIIKIQAAKNLELAGSTIGNIMGVQKPEPEAATDSKPEENAESEAKNNGKDFFPNEKPNEAVSNFSRTKTMKQQREFLPIFSVREDLLKVVRDNQSIDDLIISYCHCWRNWIRKNNTIDTIFK